MASSDDIITIKEMGDKRRWWQYLDATKWKLFIAALIGVTLDGYDFVLITLALPEIKAAFGLTLVQSAALVSAAFITRWLGGLILGGVGDRFGRKPAMIIATVLFAIGSLLMGFSPNFMFLFIMRMVVGFAMAGEYGSSATYVIESWHPRIRGKASSFLLSGYAIGAILAVQVDKYLVPWADSWHAGWGWRALFITGIVPIAVALYMRRRLPEASDWETAKSREREKSSESRDAFQVLFSGRRMSLNITLVIAAMAGLLAIFALNILPFWGVLAVAIACGAIFVCLIVQFDPRRWVIGIGIMIVILSAFMYGWPILGLLPTYLTGAGYAASTVANLLTIAQFGNMIGYFVTGFMGDWIGMRKWYFTSILIAQIIVFPLFFAGIKSAWLIGLLLFFNQFFGQGVSGLAPRWVSSYFPVEQRAAGVGFIYNVGALGGAIGPFVGASLAKSHGLGSALGVLSVGFGLIVVLGVRLNLPRKLQALVNPEAVRPEDGDDRYINSVDLSSEFASSEC